MKNVLIMIGLLLVGTATFAQRTSDATPELRAQRQTKNLSKQLTLDADQEKKIYALQLTRAQKMQEIHEAGDQSRDARPRIKSINDDFQQSLNEILTADQKTKYSTMQTEMRQTRGQRKGEMQKDSSDTKRKRSRGPRKQ